MTAPVKGVALLGCGDVAGLHAGTLRRVAPEVDLYFASRDGARAREFARRNRGAGWFDGYEAALRDPRVDLTLVLTPPRLHLEWTLAALEAGKHVVVEKPAFPTSRDFHGVEEAGAQGTARVLVAENYHYRPLAEALRRLLAGGDLGDLLFLHVDAVKTQSVSGWRDDLALSGGGALMEGGIHWVSFLAHLGPRVESVHAVRPRPSAEPERSMALLMQYQGGGAATLHYSWEVPSPLKGLRLSRVYGTEGAVTFESNGLFMFQRGRRWRLHFPGFRDIRGYGAMFRDFLDALGSGREARFRLADARRDVELVEEAYRSAGVPSLEPGSTP